MPKRPKSLETVVLALELLRRIPRGGKISAAELHLQLKELGLSRNLRTIQRLLETLSEHFDIERDDRDKPYGYRWKEKARALSVPVLNEQESLLLTLAEQHLRNLLPASLMKSMESFFSQARSNLTPLTSAKREREWLGKVRVVDTTQPLLPPKIAPGVFDQVSNALFTNRWLNIEYKNAAGACSAAEVMPLGLAQQGARLYLVCRYRGFENELTLAIHRFITARASTFSFQRPSDFDLKRFDDEGRFGFGNGQLIQLSFRIAKVAGLHLLESPLSEGHSVRELPNYYQITATVVDTAQLSWWLQGFGDQVSLVRKAKLATKPRREKQQKARLITNVGSALGTPGGHGER
jgi:predicted DNA-binding transcriptional regulator YafY